MDPRILHAIPAVIEAPCSHVDADKRIGFGGALPLQMMANRVDQPMLYRRAANPSRRQDRQLQRRRGRFATVLNGAEPQPCPPPLACCSRELWRDLAETLAKAGRRRGRFTAAAGSKALNVRRA
jgi:hypothetical protein